MAGAGIDGTATASPVSHELRTAIGELLTRAQEAGAVRRDVGVADAMALVTGTVIAIQRQGDDPELPTRILGVSCDGLRAGTPSARRFQGWPKQANRRPTLRPYS